MTHFKFNIGFITFFSFCLVSCNTEVKQENSNTDSPKSENETLIKLSAIFKKELTLPLNIDSVFLAQEHLGDSLGTNEIKLLTINSFQTDSNNGMTYELGEFYKIDSIKASGTYAKWCETLDIGMTKHSNAYAIGKIVIDKNIPLLVWAFTHSSYEACPWSSGTSVFCTILNPNETGESFLLGESFGAGDAPVSMRRETYGTLNTNGSLTLNTKEVNDDADASESELTTENTEYLIKNGKVTLVKKSAKQTVKVPHPIVAE